MAATPRVHAYDIQFFGEATADLRGRSHHHHWIFTRCTVVYLIKRCMSASVAMNHTEICLHPHSFQLLFMGDAARSFAGNGRRIDKDLTVPFFSKAHNPNSRKFSRNPRKPFNIFRCLLSSSWEGNLSFRRRNVGSLFCRSIILLASKSS